MLYISYYQGNYYILDEEAKSVYSGQFHWKALFFYPLPAITHTSKKCISPFITCYNDRNTVYGINLFFKSLRVGVYLRERSYVSKLNIKTLNMQLNKYTAFNKLIVIRLSLYSKIIIDHPCKMKLSKLASK